MNPIQAFILEQPKTYIPLLGLTLTWGSDLIAQQLNIPFVLSPEMKEGLTVLLITAAMYLMRRNTVKDKDMDKKLEDLTAQITKQLRKKK